MHQFDFDFRRQVPRVSTTRVSTTESESRDIFPIFLVFRSFRRKGRYHSVTFSAAAAALEFIYCSAFPRREHFKPLCRHHHGHRRPPIFLMSYFDALFNFAQAAAAGSHPQTSIVVVLALSSFLSLAALLAGFFRGPNSSMLRSTPGSVGPKGERRSSRYAAEAPREP